MCCLESVNEVEGNGRTALMYSAMADQSDTLTLLIKRGAVLAIQDSQGQTALHWAAITGSYKCLRVLLSRSTEVHIKDNDGRYVLFLHPHTRTTHTPHTPYTHIQDTFTPGH